ncbi:hypothetical protein JCM10908_000928 [Rhodotorula pacifica]|uniref:homeobox domain-containing protein n=1 Tax=Rhodotorula pacifica TaxID=1495444 RepID=UPI003181B920
MQEVETSFSSALRDGRLDDVVPDVLRLFRAVQENLTAGTMHPADKQAIVALAQRIQIVVEGLDALAADTERGLATTRQDVRALFQKESPALVDLTSDAEASTEAIYTPLRYWFLSHFDYPYTTDKDRDTLALQVYLNQHQIGTWFINARRRSGWTAFRRDFAGTTLESFQHLLSTLDEPGNEEAKDRYERIRLYFEPDRKDVPSETILEVIKQGQEKPASLTKKKQFPNRAAQRAAKRAARGLGAQHVEADLLAPRVLVRDSWSPRRRNDLPLVSSSTPPPSFDPYSDFHRNSTPSPPQSGTAPRYPSVFSSPAMSARSFSDASSSSLDSLVSYGSSDYAPQIARMEDPQPFEQAPAYSAAPQPHASAFTSSAPSTLSYPVSGLYHPHSGPSSFSAPTRPHPYFCTLNELSRVPTFGGGFANLVSRR